MPSKPEDELFNGCIIATSVLVLLVFFLFVLPIAVLLWRVCISAW